MLNCGNKHFGDAGIIVVTAGTIQVVDVLLIKRHNLYKVLACSTTFFQLSLFCAPITYVHALYIFQNVIFATYFRSSSWSFRHGFPSLDLLHIIILGHALNMA